jgi:S1-C subfamily serine protease
MPRLLWTLSVLLFLIGPAPLAAQQLLERYQARLSEADHFNSQGQRLTTPAAVIRQDRANFHRFGAGDQEDEPDRFFANQKNREILERMLQRGRADQDAVNAIVNSTPLIQVEVWRDANGPYIIVKTLPEPAAQKPASTSPSPPQSTRSGSGSGFFVSRAGHIVTNAHVVAGCSSVKVVDADRSTSRASTIAISATDDLALLKIDRQPAAVARFPESARVAQGATVVAYGFPLAPLLASSGSVSTGLVTALAGLRDNPRQLQISAPVQPGNSGGPLVDSRGVLVGVIVAKLDAIAVAGVTGDIPQNVNFAIKSSAVLDLLDAQGIAYQRDDKGPELSVEAITQSVRAYTVRVECE